MKIAISCGDCNGIGLEVLVKALLSLAPSELADTSIQLIIHPQILVDYLSQIGVEFSIHDNMLNLGTICIDIITCQTQAEINLGQERSDAAALAFESLQKAAQLCVSGAVDAVVTLPVSKKNLHTVGFTHPGQTEFFAEASNSLGQELMILCHNSLRVALQTIHIALKDVAAHIQRDAVLQHIRSLHLSCRRDYDIAQPRIAVLGLNPHAGENGDIGTEEREVILLAINDALAEGMHIEGPFPADGFFAHGSYAHYDGILAMYHDQGLIPLKLLAGGAGVNFSANLPIVRCSPDHGTAYTLAGKNLADGASTREAILLARSIVMNRMRFATVSNTSAL